MNKCLTGWLTGMLAVLLIGSVAAVTYHVQASSAPPNASMSAMDHSAHAAKKPSVPQKKYHLKASVITLQGQKHLKVQTNLRLTDRNYGGDPVPGEGHIHYYVNGQIVGPITDNKPFLMTNLSSGTNQIRLVLAQNNHVEDMGASVELTVEHP